MQAKNCVAYMRCGAAWSQNVNMGLVEGCFMAFWAQNRNTSLEVIAQSNDGELSMNLGDGIE